MASRDDFDFDNVDVPDGLILAISVAFTKIEIPDPGKMLDNVLEGELVTDFRDGFSKGDISHAAKSSLKTRLPSIDYTQILVQHFLKHWATR